MLKTLPTYEEAEEAMLSNTVTPLDIFILNNEPAGITDEENFRKELLEAIKWAQSVYNNK